MSIITDMQNIIMDMLEITKNCEYSKHQDILYDFPNKIKDVTTEHRTTQNTLTAKNAAQLVEWFTKNAAQLVEWFTKAQ